MDVIVDGFSARYGQEAPATSTTAGQTYRPHQHLLRTLFSRRSITRESLSSAQGSALPEGMFPALCIPVAMLTAWNAPPRDPSAYPPT